MHGMPDLIARINRLATDEALLRSVEEATRQAAVLPILSDLGWDWSNLGEVVPEFAVGAGRVDYCLREANRSLVLVEVKRAGTDLTNHQEQLLGYAFKEGAHLAVLTDGLVWWLYLPTEPGSWEQRKFFVIDIQRQASEEAAASFERFMSRELVLSGKAVTSARAELTSQERERRIEAALPVAWRQLLSGPDELLVELLADATAGIAGHRPDAETVAQFLSTASPPSGQTAPRPMLPPAPTSATPPQPSTPSPGQVYTGHVPKAFSLRGLRHEVKTWRELLIETCARGAEHVGDQFESLVVPIRGRKRMYFARTSAGLVVPLLVPGTGLFVEGNLSANDCVRLARRVIAAIFGNDEVLTVELA